MHMTLKRSLAGLLTLLLILLSFGACTANEGGTESQTTEALTDGQTDAPTAEETTGTADTNTPEPDYLSMPFAAKAGRISVFGNQLSRYLIVIPAECDLYTQYAAQNFADYIYANTATRLRITTDEKAATSHEFLFGKTNRPASQRAMETPLEANEYIMLRDGSSIAFYGESYMVGAGAGRFITHLAAGAWRGYDINITNVPETPVPAEFTFEAPKNALLLIGDGMGQAHIDMTVDSGTLFSAADMPVKGQLVTSSISVLMGKSTFTDSAAGGTALATGYKTVNTYIGVDKDGNTLQNIRELAHASGAKTAILTTDNIIGATPSAFLAHASDRTALDSLGENLTQLKKEQKVDVAQGSLTDDDFFETSTKALYTISKNGSRFFAMIEESDIDKYSHDHDAENLVHVVKRFDNMVAYCMEFMFYHPDTLLIVTADHETGGLTRQEDGSYLFTDPTHTGVNVPLFAMGITADYFADATRDNTRVPIQIAKIFSDKPYGDSTYE